MTVETNQVSNFNFKEIFGGKDLKYVDDIIANKANHIKVFTIPKKSGGERTITAPSPELKYLQNAILWKILKRYKEHELAHGFVIRRGIATNAIRHVGAKSLGSIDVSNFFDSITAKMLTNILFGNKNICKYCKFYERMTNKLCQPSLYKEKKEKSKYPCEEIKSLYIPEYDEKTGYESLFKRIIALCTTIDGVTAQGFPTSPKFANLVLRGFDKSIKKYCDEKKIQVSRYADDICISSKLLDKKELYKATKNKITQLLWAYGFQVNKKKVVYKNSTGRLKVCGVVVNKKLSIQKSRLRLFRAQVHNAVVKNAGFTNKIRIRKLKGFAAFVMSVDPDKGKKYMAQLVDYEKRMNKDNSWGEVIAQEDLPLDNKTELLCKEVVEESVDHPDAPDKT